MNETLNPDLIQALNQIVDRAITAIENDPNSQGADMLFEPLSQLGYALDQLNEDQPA